MPTPHAVGDKVQARWPPDYDGYVEEGHDPETLQWWGAVVKKVNGHSGPISIVPLSYALLFDDGLSHEAVCPALVRGAGGSKRKRAAAPAKKGKTKAAAAAPGGDESDEADESSGEESSGEESSGEESSGEDEGQSKPGAAAAGAGETANNKAKRVKRELQAARKNEKGLKQAASAAHSAHDAKLGKENAANSELRLGFLLQRADVFRGFLSPGR
jgi:hypothetical protein